MTQEIHIDLLLTLPSNSLLMCVYLGAYVLCEILKVIQYKIKFKGVSKPCKYVSVFSNLTQPKLHNSVWVCVLVWVLLPVLPFLYLATIIEDKIRYKKTMEERKEDLLNKLHPEMKKK